MKRLFFFVLSLATCLISMLVLVACDSASTSTLYVYNWGEYISDGSEGSLDVNAEFEKYYYETYGERIKVNYSTFSSNEDMYAKISKGAVKYDVIFPSDYMIERLINENLLAELDYGNIPNYQYVFDSFKGENAFYDPSNKYTVPYAYGMIGIIYNSSFVDESDEDIGSWSLMWDEDYTGEILQFNNSRDAFGTALYYLGYDVNEGTSEQWNEALNLLKEQKPLVQAYVMDEIFNKMKGGSASIASYYAGDYLSMYEFNEDLSFYYPKEGTNFYVDAMCVPASSQNKTMAERYINFLLSEEIAVANAEYTYYATPNTLVTENTEYIEYMTDIHPDAMNILYSQTNEIKTSSYKNLSPDKLRMINELWEDLKIESTIGTGIYVICGLILGSIVVFAVYSVVKKRKRDKLCSNLFD